MAKWPVLTFFPEMQNCLCSWMTTKNQMRRDDVGGLQGGNRKPGRGDSSGPGTVHGGPTRLSGPRSGHAWGAQTDRGRRAGGVWEPAASMRAARRGGRGRRLDGMRQIYVLRIFPCFKSWSLARFSGGKFIILELHCLIQLPKLHVAELD